MPKIKMSDVTSGSENVKALFRMTMENRIKSIKLRVPLSSDELLEVLSLTNIENYSDKRLFFQQLIQKQPGPFDSNVFNNYVSILFDKNSLLELLQKTDSSVRQQSKIKWIEYIGVTAAHWFIYDFVGSSIATKCGIDAYSTPYNASIAKVLIHQILRKQHTIQPESLAELFKIFDSMNAVELEQLYDEFKHIYVTVVFEVVMGYKKMPGSVIGAFFNATRPLQDEIAVHPNCPPDIKKAMYEKTKDYKYLPQEMVDIFCW